MVKDDIKVQVEVLILILMEDTLGVVKANSKKDVRNVLILILMEDTLGVRQMVLLSHNQQGLNPYSNGRYSRSLWEILSALEMGS